MGSIWRPTGGRASRKAAVDPTVPIPAPDSSALAAPAAFAAAPSSPAPPASPTRRALQPWPLPPWQRLQRALAVDPLDYLRALTGAAAAPTARPSSLQTLIKRGQHTASSLCRPLLALGGTRLADLPTDSTGQLLPVQAGVAQCYLSLGTSKAVPHSGVVDRQAWLHVARVCLYDGHRFHGNVQAILPRKVRLGKRSDSWTFDLASPLLVRCPIELLPRMQLYIELNVSYQLLPEEVQRLPALPQRAARQADELCVSWALVDLSTLPTLHEARSLCVPLRGGPLVQSMTLQECTAAAVTAAAAGGHMDNTASSSAGFGTGARLPIKLSPVPAGERVAALLPATAVASVPMAQVVALYRQLLAEALGTGEGSTALDPVADQALASFPAMLDDADMAHAFFSMWERQSTARGAPSAGQLKSLFRQCVTVMWAAMGTQVLPPASIANHRAHQIGRQQRIQQYLQQHPVAGLNSSAHTWLHTPFNAQELVCGPLQRLGATV